VKQVLEALGRKIKGASESTPMLRKKEN